MHFHLSNCIISAVIHYLKKCTQTQKEIKGPTCMKSKDQKEMVLKYFGDESLLKTK